jgi:cyclopropane fatty-acyl-phospholipid synthase-like methyltransferase
MTKDFWAGLDKETAGDAILTGYTGEFEDMPVYTDVISLAGDGKSALDFGCGVGRNTRALSKSFKSVVGYDLPNMISLVPHQNKNERTEYSADWHNIKTLKFDAVLASLVFQHIDESELDQYVSDISKMTNKLVMHSRTWIDHTEVEVLPIVEKYFTMETVVYQKDPNGNSNDHFIAVLNSKAE